MYINAYLILFKVNSNNTIPHSADAINYHLVEWLLYVLLRRHPRLFFTDFLFI